jgi:hypothetical protein
MTAHDGQGYRAGGGEPSAELRRALIDAVAELPYIRALANRRLLLKVIRADVPDFPDVLERTEARLHVVEICHRVPRASTRP